MSDLLTRDELLEKKATAPAKAWRNWWRAHYGGLKVIRVDGAVVPDGGEFCDPNSYPSKEVAEQCALDCLAEIKREMSRWSFVAWLFWRRAKPHFTYIGALPEGERP